MAECQQALLPCPLCAVQSSLLPLHVWKCMLRLVYAARQLLYCPFASCGSDIAPGQFRHEQTALLKQHYCCHCTLGRYFSSTSKACSSTTDSYSAPACAPRPKMLPALLSADAAHAELSSTHPATEHSGGRRFQTCALIQAVSFSCSITLNAAFRRQRGGCQSSPPPPPPPHHARLIAAPCIMSPLPVLLCFPVHGLFTHPHVLPSCITRQAGHAPSLDQDQTREAYLEPSWYRGNMRECSSSREMSSSYCNILSLA